VYKNSLALIMSKAIGSFMETLALNFLKEQGLKLLQRNFTTRMGEIDLIMLEAKTLVFVEVRCRRNQSAGNVLESIDFFKQQKLSNTAELFLQTHPPYQNQDCRFDVIAFSTDNKKPLWIRNAF
jgi:putative endonuclease